MALVQVTTSSSRLAQTHAPGEGRAAGQSGGCRVSGGLGSEPAQHVSYNLLLAKPALEASLAHHLSIPTQHIVRTGEELGSVWWGAYTGGGMMDKSS